MKLDRVRPFAILAVVALPTLVVATLIVGYLQDVLGVPNPSAVYLVAVVACAYAAGTLGAIVAAVASALTYNWFFTEPRYTFTIGDPLVWLSVVTLLFVGVVVGQLAAVQRSRTHEARLREREATALFRLSRALATRTSTAAVLPEIAAILLAETRMTRIWVALGADDASERIATDTATGQPTGGRGRVHLLRRAPGEQPATWALLHDGAPRAGTEPGRLAAATGFERYRIRIEAGGAALGSVWARRERANGLPDRFETRLLSAAADQLGQALANDRLAEESRHAEIARESDALKSALLQSVSHDLRTPLATIRAAAGTLRPGSNVSEADQRESADTIDREVEYLNRLVTNLLDLSRIEAGALRPEREVYDLEGLLEPILDRLRPRLAGHPVTVEIPPVAVLVDGTFLEGAVTNVLENAIKYTPPGAPIRISATRAASGALVRLTIEDGGPGVPPQYLGRLFEKFFRVPGSGRGSRAGTGVGLAVVRGLVEAMGGHATARRGELGGLAIDLDLALASLPEERAREAGIVEPAS